MEQWGTTLPKLIQNVLLKEKAVDVRQANKDKIHPAEQLKKEMYIKLVRREIINWVHDTDLTNQNPTLSEHSNWFKDKHVAHTQPMKALSGVNE